MKKTIISIPLIMILFSCGNEFTEENISTVQLSTNKKNSITEELIPPTISYGGPLHYYLPDQYLFQISNRVNRGEFNHINVQYRRLPLENSKLVYDPDVGFHYDTPWYYYNPGKVYSETPYPVPVRNFHPSIGGFDQVLDARYLPNGKFQIRVRYVTDPKITSPDSTKFSPLCEMSESWTTNTKGFSKMKDDDPFYEINLRITVNLTISVRNLGSSTATFEIMVPGDRYPTRISVNANSTERINRQVIHNGVARCKEYSYTWYSFDLMGKVASVLVYMDPLNWGGGTPPSVFNYNITHEVNM